MEEWIEKEKMKTSSKVRIPDWEKIELSEKKDQECYNRSHHHSIPSSTDLRVRRKGLENGMKKKRERKKQE